MCTWESAAPEMVSLLDPSGGFFSFVLFYHWLNMKPAVGWVKDHKALKTMRDTVVSLGHVCVLDSSDNTATELRMASRPSLEMLSFGL